MELKQNDLITVPGLSIDSAIIVRHGEGRMTIVEDRRGTRWQVQLNGSEELLARRGEDTGLPMLVFGIGSAPGDERLEMPVGCLRTVHGTDLSRYLMEEVEDADYKGTFIPESV